MRERIVVRAALATLGCAVVTLAYPVGAFGAPKTYRPNKLGDHVPNGCTHSDCTLREALIAANGHPGHDHLILEGGKRYNLTRLGTGEDACQTGDLDILDDVTITNSGRRRAKVDGNGIDRVFHFPDPSGATGVLKELVITGGDGTVGGDSGGAIEFSAGHLRLLKSLVTKNKAANYGGAIDADTAGSMRISKSTLSSNRSISTTGTGEGGAIWSGINTTIRDSTISGNRAQNDGGGILFRTLGDPFKLTIIDGTIANNRADGAGGGIEADQGAAARLNGVTIARNLADADNAGSDPGGGLFYPPDPSSQGFVISNSLIALNKVGSSGSDPNCSGLFTSAGHNLRTTSDPDCSGFTSPGDLVRLNPRIGPLADNGGPTKTIALLPHSPAIGHAGAGSPDRDQRGVKRDEDPDIGAYERR